jgi:hypothetical protein
VTTAAPSTYKTEDVPASASDLSRYHIGSTSAGWAVDPVENVACSWHEMAMSIEGRLPKFQSLVTVDLQRVVQIEPAVYAIAKWTSVTKAQTLVDSYAGGGKFWKPPEETAATLLDAFVTMEGETFEKVKDRAVLAALLGWAEANEPTPQVLRTANIAIGVALCNRRGLKVSPSELP